MRSRMPIRLPGRKWLIGAAVAALLFLSYLWAGYVLAPRLIRSEATRWTSEHPGLSLGLGTIKVDPLRFTLSIRAIHLTDRGSALFTLGRLYIAISPLSLVERGYDITALDLDQPAVHVVMGADGTVNLAALQGPAGPASGPAPLVRIDDLRVSQGALSFTDLGRKPAARLAMAPINFRLTRFRTRGTSNGRFVLQADGDGANLAWQGRVSLSPFASRGTVSLNELRARLLAQFLPPHLPMTPEAGQLSLSAQYDVAQSARGLDTRLSAVDFVATGLDLHGSDLHGNVQIARIEANSGGLHVASGASATGSLPALTLHGLQLTGTGPAAGETLRLARLSLEGTRLDEGHHRLSASSLDLAGISLPVRRTRNGRITLLRFLPASSPTPAPTAGSARPRPAAWQFQLAHLTVTDAVAPVEDRAVSPAARFRVTLHSLTATSLSNDLERAVPFTVRASIDRAYLALDGRVTPASRSAALWLSLAHLSLKTFTPYLPLAPSAQLHSGELGMRGFAELARGNLIRVSGRLDARDVRLRDRTAGTGLFGWRDLTLSGLEYRPAHLVIGHARLTAPTGLIEILPNRTLNLAALAPPPAKAGALPAHAPRRPVARPRQAPAFAALLRRLDIEKGSITFADESIEPNFRAPIDELRGTISNVSTSHSAIAHISLAGQVINQYSPVTVAGTFNPYGLGRSTDIRVAFENIQLPIFNPYSDFYAGYAIAKGTLSTRFHYRIVNRELHADHHIVIDQLQWGGPSGSKHRVGWPIRLATALLKNRAGVIRLDLPVTGSLDNPHFDIWPIVWTMLRHLLVKAALAPFDLIGRLFAGAQKAQYIDFVPGSAALPPEAANSLTALAHALAQRPAVQVDVPAGPAGATDEVAIEDARIDALLIARTGGHRPQSAPLSLSKQLRALASLYRARLKKRPPYPPHLPLPATSTAGSTGASPADKTRLLEQAKIQWLRRELRPTVRPSASALTALGLARATHVQAALLAKGILKPDRVFLTANESGTPWRDRIRIKLALK